MKTIAATIKVAGRDATGEWKEEIHQTRLYLDTQLDLERVGIEWSEECELDVKQKTQA